MLSQKRRNSGGRGSGGDHGPLGAQLVKKGRKEIAEDDLIVVVAGQKLTCGRCGAKNFGAKAVAWRMMFNADGVLCAAGAGCLRCYTPFNECWKKPGYQWVQICGTCKEDLGSDGVSIVSHAMHAAHRYCADPARTRMHTHIL